MVVAGVNEADMALAVNQVRELEGGIAVCADGKILAEIALPVGGLITMLPMETISDTLHHIQRTAAGLGCTQGDIRQTLSVLTTGGIPFLRICEFGLVDIRQNRFVDLVADWA
jgi:adenine deaminase